MFDLGLYCLLRPCLNSILFSLFSIATPSPGEERAGLYAIHVFVCFARDGLCLFPLPLGVRDCLRLVIVALPGFFRFTFI